MFSLFTMQNQSNVRFLLGAQLEDPTAELLTFQFQQDICGEKCYSLQVPGTMLQKLGRRHLIEYVADYYLQLQPQELDRIDRNAVIMALNYAGF
ncbi:hypothetical protein ACFP2F_11765 [Hymenobacter artigasi]|uniref:Uncharacterized protein n=1 Tax=Hymenobacter artigasi TaxID=2719616 RepID=A0ABX1HKD9_9BACT|nr:hypothetical protein [Hymenobacter artigasi]NKI89497.1 hypothetical protein [Hymenobacter artigasi]